MRRKLRAYIRAVRVTLWGCATYSGRKEKKVAAAKKGNSRPTPIQHGRVAHWQVFNMDGRPAYEGTLDESRLFQQLPNEIVELIRAASGTQYLNALAVGALKSQCTEGFFALYEPIFVDIAARWLQSDIPVNQVDVLSAFARILPFAPYLRSFASQYTLSRVGPLSKELTSLQLDDIAIRTLLLAIFRLLSFDLEVFSKTVSPSQIQSLFRHSDRSLRYLAVRCFALYMHAADAATEKMVQKHVGDKPIEGSGKALRLTTAVWDCGRNGDGKCWKSRSNMPG